MRINVYAEELTQRTEMIFKSPPNHPTETFRGVRFYLLSPDELHDDPDDDDSSAITLWVPWTKANGHDHGRLIVILQDMLTLLWTDAKMAGNKALGYETRL